VLDSIQGKPRMGRPPRGRAPGSDLFFRSASAFAMRLIEPITFRQACQPHREELWEGTRPGIIINEFAVRPDLLRRAVAQHRIWIEQQLGLSLSEAVILESDLDIATLYDALA
jgi:hypothetical protein